ncbi:MAG: ABC transporter permease, partial [Coriobacteriales bacterium]|nr:ABC transporter permease [Coriobacteriales bacterium]
QYANRTVKLYDGRIQADSNPFIPPVEDVMGKERPHRRTAMSFLTAISLSFTNLMTKKGRTIMTAFAGSIGIIGIAAILSLANGVNNYIKNVEENLLTVYPLSIQSTGMDFTALISASVSGRPSDEGSSGGSTAGTAGATGAEGEGEEAELVIEETRSIVNTFSSIGQNDLAALKAYFDKDGGGINQYVNAIEYSYGLTPQIYSSDTSNGPIQVNPDVLTRSMGLDQGGGFTQFMTLGASATMFNPLVEDTSLLEGQYDVVSGKWPENYSECVVVLDYAGHVSDYMLYLMGFRDPAELESMVEQFQNEEEIATPEDTLELSPDELLGVTFKLVSATEYYAYDETYEIWTDKRSDEEYVTSLVEAGQTLSVVGILREKPDATATSLGQGIYYPASLTYHLMEQAAQTQIVQDQLADSTVNVFSGKTFAEEKESSGFDAFSFGDLMTIDEDAIASAFSMDPSALNVDLAGALDPTKLAESLPAPPEPDLTDIGSQLDIDIPTEAIVAIAGDVMEAYLVYCFENGITTPQAIRDGLPAYLSRPDVQVRLALEVNKVVNVDDLQNELQQAISLYMQETMTSYMTSAMTAMQKQIETALASSMQQLGANMAGAMSIDEDAFMNAFQFNMDEEQLSQLVMTMMSGESNTYDNNLKKLGYADSAKPSGIDIYPFDFESKQNVADILTAYNKEMEAAGEEDKVVTYTDLVGLLMTSVTDIINMISYVLVAFVAISLVVSSIMIGVITYISVLERKKEIGILRAIGARKRDIGNVFNAETLIVGLAAGLMGILITLLLTIPANIIVESSFGVKDIAILPTTSAVVLILISMGLTFIAGLIPSSAASRRDPVEALRSE